MGNTLGRLKGSFTFGTRALGLINFWTDVEPLWHCHESGELFWLSRLWCRLHHNWAQLNHCLLLLCLAVVVLVVVVRRGKVPCVEMHWVFNLLECFEPVHPTSPSSKHEPEPPDIIVLGHWRVIHSTPAQLHAQA